MIIGCKQNYYLSLLVDLIHLTRIAVGHGGLLDRCKKQVAESKDVDKRKINYNKPFETDSSLSANSLVRERQKKERERVRVH